MRQPLSADAVIDTALRVVDRDGLDALSMRRVAQDLGTGAASLYAYFANKDELLEHLLDRVVGDIPLPVAEPGEDWADTVRRSCRASRAVLLTHRDLVKVARTVAWTAARTAPPALLAGPNSLRHTEALLAVLRGAGIPDRIVAWGIDQLSRIVVDAVESSAAGRIGCAEAAGPAGEPYTSEIGDYLRMLPAGRFPNLVAMSSTLTEARTTDEDDARFAFAVDVVLAGLARTVTASAAAGAAA